MEIDEEAAQDLIQILFKNGYKKPIEINKVDLTQKDDDGFTWLHFAAL